jgi:phytoene desaturase
MVKLGAALPLHLATSRFFEHPRIREAFSFHSLFIGGDPFRVPAIYGALVYLQFLDGVWYADGGVYAIIEAMARALDVRCGDGVERIETAGGRVTGVLTRGGQRIPADAVVTNADAFRVHEMLGQRKPLRPMAASMSAFLLYLGTDRQFPQLLHHTLLVGSGYKEFIKDVTRRGRLPRTYSTYVHAPNRTEPGMAAEGGDSLCFLLPVPHLGSGSTGTASPTAARGARPRPRGTFGLGGLDASVRVEHRMTPADFRDELGAHLGNAWAMEPTLHQSAAMRPPNRDKTVRGLYRVGGGTHPGAGIPGRAARRRGDRRDWWPRTCSRGGPVLLQPDQDVLAEARATTNRVARTFSIACRLLPRELRDDVYLLYLVFRTLDDLVDDGMPDGLRAHRRRRGLVRRRAGEHDGDPHPAAT